MVAPKFFMHQIAVPGAPGNITAEEAAQVRADLAAWEALLAAFGIDDLDDVDLAGLAGGQVLIYDGATSTWKPGAIQNGVPTVRRDAASVNTNVLTLNFGSQFGITVPGGSPTWVNIVPIWGGNGVAETFAHSDHWHQIPSISPLTFPASGSLSSGTRTLFSGTISGLTAANTYLIKASLTADLRGEGTGAGFSLPSITLNGTKRNRFGNVRTVAGVDRDFTMAHQGATVSGVTSVPIVAELAFQPGDPVYVGAGELDIRIESNR